MLNVTIRRDVKPKLYKFTEFFKGFEKVNAVRELFGEKTNKVLNELKVEFCSSRHGYMWVSEDGHIVISINYLKNGNERDIYLDIIHELFHIKQIMEKKEPFNNQIDYVDRPAEIEAYKFTIKEARRIGMSDEEIFEYLKVDWISDDEAKKLAKALGIKTPDC